MHNNRQCFLMLIKEIFLWQTKKNEFHNPSESFRIPVEGKESQWKNENPNGRIRIPMEEKVSQYKKKKKKKPRGCLKNCYIFFPKSIRGGKYQKKHRNSHKQILGWTSASGNKESIVEEMRGTLLTTRIYKYKMTPDSMPNNWVSQQWFDIHPFFSSHEYIGFFFLAGTSRVFKNTYTVFRDSVHLCFVQVNMSFWMFMS